MDWLTTAIALKPSVLAKRCWQHVLSGYVCIKQTIANGIGGSECEDNIGAESVNIEDDLRAAADLLVNIVALVARMRISNAL